jgi:hypothetical protein
MGHTLMEKIMENFVKSQGVYLNTKNCCGERKNPLMLATMLR